MDDDFVPRKVPLKQILHYLGLALTVASLAFLGHALFRQYGRIVDFHWEIRDLAALTGSIAIVTAGLFGLAFSWALMLHDEGDSRHRLLSSIIVYTDTSVLKYLPGNVFHFVGRNIAAHGSDRGHVRMAAATVFEIGLSLVSAMLLSALVFAFMPAPLSQVMFRIVAISLVATISVILFRPQLVERVVGLLPVSVSESWLPRNLAAAMTANLVGFAGFMLGAAILCVTLLPGEVDPVSVSAYFIFAWLVGFAVPGAPGGLGVREAFLVMELTPLTGEADALAFALVTRLMTTGGDFGLYLGGKLLARLTGNGSV